MAESEVISFTFQFSGEDQFQSAMNKMASSAEQTVQKINSAFSQIKTGGTGGEGAGAGIAAVSKKLDEIPQHAAHAGNAVHEMQEKLARAFSGMSGVLGEPAKLLGEFTEKVGHAASSIGSAAGGIVGAFAGVGAGIAAALGGAEIAKWGGEAVERLDQLRQSANLTAESFAQLREMTSGTNITTKELTPIVGRLNEGIHNAGVNLDQQIDMMEMYEDRLNSLKESTEGMTEAQRKQHDQERKRIAEERIEVRERRAQRMITESGDPVERVFTNVARYVQGSDLSVAALRRIRDEVQKLEDQPAEFRWIAPLEKLKELEGVKPEVASRLRNLIGGEISAKFGETIDEYIKKGREQKKLFDELGAAGYAEKIKLPETGASKMAEELKNTVGAFGRLGEAAEKAGIAIAAVFAFPATAIVNGLTTVVNGLKNIVEAAENAASAFGKISFGGLGELVTELATLIKEQLGGAIKSVVEGIKSLGEAAGSVFGSLGTMIGGVVKAATGLVKIISGGLKGDPERVAAGYKQTQAGVGQMGYGAEQLYEGLGLISQETGKKLRERIKEMGYDPEAEKAEEERKKREAEAAQAPAGGRPQWMVAAEENRRRDLEDARKMREQVAEPQHEAAAQHEEAGNKHEEAGDKHEEAGAKSEEAAGKVEELGTKSDEASGKVDSLGGKSDEASGKVGALGDNADKTSGEVGALGDAAAAAIAKMSSGGGGKAEGGSVGDVPIMASNGEYLINAGAARQWGGGVLDAINEGRIKFQDGGGVDPETRAARQSHIGYSWHMGEDPEEIAKRRPQQIGKGPSLLYTQTKDGVVYGWETQREQAFAESTKDREAAERARQGKPLSKDEEARAAAGEYGLEAGEKSLAQYHLNQKKQSLERLKRLFSGIQSAVQHQAELGQKGYSYDPNSVYYNGRYWSADEVIVLRNQIAQLEQEGYQRGGLISGPGTSTSDSIPIRASRGEYVMRASAVSHYGKRFMDAINSAPQFNLGGIVSAFNLHLPRFQAGGSVSGPASAPALHPVTIQLPGGESVSGFHATPDAISQLNRHAVLAQASSTGRKPSWVR